jgi:hypothetical protein
METPMLRNAILVVAALALAPTLAIAAPAAKKMTHTAITQPVKAEKVTLTEHRKVRFAHKVRMERQPKAKTETVKS